MTTNSEFLFSGGGGGAYQIERSVRFNSADSAYLSRTPSVAGNRKTWTWSGWVKRSKLGATAEALFTSSDNATATTGVYLGLYNIWGVADAITFYTDRTGAYTVTTTSVLRDPSAWYHIVISVDTTQATQTDRVKVYVNGAEQTLTGNFPLQDFETEANRASFIHAIGSHIGGTWRLSAYLSDIYFIDGQALDPTSFGDYDTYGVWQPKAYTGTYGTNGFHLPFSDNSTAAALGTDTSGNNNTWTTNNLSVAAGAGNDSLVDTPTNYGTDTGAGGDLRGNYATLNPLNKGSQITLSNGNLDYTHLGNTLSCRVIGTIGMTSGKWYCEHTATTASTLYVLGITKSTEPPDAGYVGSTAGSYGYYAFDGNKYNSNTSSAYGASYGNGDVVGIAFDADSGTIEFYKNGVSQGVAFTSIPEGTYHFAQGDYTGSAYSGTFNFGQRPFAYAAPTGYKALCTQNLPDPTIADGSTAMDVVTYTGNNNTNVITGLGFSPDLVWTKSRSSALNHTLFDTVRTRDYGLYPNLTNTEPVASAANTDLASFDSAGFTLGGNYNFSVNDSGVTFAAWAWDAGSSTVTNTDGSITSQVRANPSAGFSIVTYTGTGSSVTVGHGLNATPGLVIIKGRGTTFNWITWHSSFGATDYIALNSNSAMNYLGALTNIFQSFSSSTFGIGNAGSLNQSNENYVAYCFAPVEGYSAFGSYTGNGSADGPFVYTGFRIRWILIKASSGISDGPWMLYDTARNTYNLSNNKLYANESRAENASSGGDTSGTNGIDILSNGFKHRQANYFVNGSGNTYIYAAFAENPFKTARAR